MRISSLAVAITALVGVVTLSQGADQTVLGNKLLVKDPSGGVAPVKRRIIAVGREKASPNTLTGSPTLLGGMLEVMTSGGTPSAQVFSLPQGTDSKSGKPFWTSSLANNTVKYKDAHGANGPVQRVTIKKAKNGSLLIKATLLGRNGTIDVVPPNPGEAGCVALTLAGGDRYSIEFGTTSLIENRETRLFLARRPVVEGVCPTLPPSGSPSGAFLTGPAAGAD